MKRLTNSERDKLLRDIDTLVTGIGTARRYNVDYTFNPPSIGEVLDSIGKAKKLLEV